MPKLQPELQEESPPKMRIQQLADLLAAKVENNEIHQSTVDLLSNLMSNVLAKPRGRRYTKPLLTLASQLKTLAHQRGLSTLSKHNLIMPSKATVNKAQLSVGCSMKTYGISKDLIMMAQQFFTSHSVNLHDTLFGLAFDSVYVAVNDSVHAASQTRHGFTAVTVSDGSGKDKQYSFQPNFRLCDSLHELLSPVIDKVAYANQVLMFVLFPLGVAQSLPIFPVGFIPLCSYNESLLKQWLEFAQQSLSSCGFDVIFHAGDNSAVHRAHFSTELASSPAAFPLLEMHQGVDSSHPIPLQDFPHLLRKLISPIVKANRCTMVGNLPIMQTLFIRAQSVFGFPVSYLMQFDEQNDKRVKFFCSTEFINWLGTQVDGKGAQLYLQHVRLLREAFLNNSISWACRVFKVWQVFCFFVYWRRWNEDKFVKAADQKFISIPTYTALTQLCISFALLVNHNYQKLDQIVPWNLSEKPCESFFSTIRSFIPNLANVSVTDCFDIVNKQVQYMSAEPGAISIAESKLDIGFELSDIKLLLSKADLEVRSCLEKTALQETISDYACAIFAYQNETEYESALYNPPGRLLAQNYPVPEEKIVEKVSRNPFASRAKNKGFITVPEVLFEKFADLGIKLFNGKASKESIINVISHRRSTNSYSSKNRLDRPSSKVTLPEHTDVLTQICSLLEMNIPDLVADESTSSHDNSDDSAMEEDLIDVNSWYWAATEGTNQTPELKLVYLAQINQERKYKRNNKDKVFHEILTSVAQSDRANYQMKALVIPTHVDGRKIICSTEIVRWDDLDLDSIIAKVIRDPKTINPWEWTNKINENYSFDELPDPDLQQFLVDPLV